MTDETKGHIIGFLFIAVLAVIGVYLVVIGIAPLTRSAKNAPGWVMIFAGAGFLLAAASFGLGALGHFRYGAVAGKEGLLSDKAPFAMRAAQILCSLGIVAALTTVATWVAFNPEADSSTGRKVAAALGALTIWVIFAGFATWRIRTLKR